jgi:hypothetical protein
MRFFILYLLSFFLVDKILYGQVLKSPEVFFIDYISTSNKFNSRGTGDIRTGNGSNSNTKYAKDVLLGTEFIINKPLSVLITSGLQIHKIQPAKPAFSSQTKTNYSIRFGAGPSFNILNSKNNLIRFRVEAIFFVEAFIRKQTTFTSASDFFGNQLWQQLIYYEDLTPRFSIDMRPFIIIKLSLKSALRIGGGYSVGLNKSGSLATYFGSPYTGLPPSAGINKQTAKENYFFFSGGIIFYSK